MAVQKDRKSRSRRGMRRAHDGLSKVTLSTDPMSGEKHLRHHISRDGYYKGRQVLPEKAEYAADDE